MTTEAIMEGAEPFFFPGNAGYTVIGPRLAGHGVSPQAMARTTAADWIASVDEAPAAPRMYASLQ